MDLNFPKISKIPTCSINPKAIPLAILYVNGIMIINTTLGMDEVRSSKSILRMPSIINTPIMIRIGEVADTGTIPAMGAKNIAKINSAAVVTAVNPVFPPSITPALLSM